MLLLFLTWKHDDCFIPQLGQHLQSSKTPDLKLEDEDEGLVPALSHDYLTPERGKRQIKSRQFKDFDTHNIIDRRVTNNGRCFKTAVRI